VGLGLVAGAGAGCGGRVGAGCSAGGGVDGNSSGGALGNSWGADEEAAGAADATGVPPDGPGTLLKVDSSEAQPDRNNPAAKSVKTGSDFIRHS